MAAAALAKFLVVACLALMLAFPASAARLEVPGRGLRLLRSRSLVYLGHISY